ncbi:MAG TPA: hypothetical protein VK470_06705, partial [Bacteroidota bacterium]|nr:hypothetical protein [Bacteroidota bacterium]
MNYETGKRYFLIFIASVVLACAPHTAKAQTQPMVGVTATADSSTISIGDWIHLTVQATHPSSVSIQWPAFRDSLGGGFDIIQADTAARRSESNGQITETRTIVVSRYEPGSSMIPAITLAYRSPNDTTVYSAQTNPIPVEVRPIAVDTTIAIKDIKPPLSVPLSWQEILLYAGIVLLLAALGYGGWWLWKKRQRKQLGIVEEKPAIPPDILALAQLHELEEKHVWQKGEIKAFYSEATEIVRRYFEGRYGVMALEMTTDEVLDQLVQFKLSREMMDEIRAFLADADLVKFAKVIPSISDNERVIPVALEIVEKTRPVAQPNVPHVQVVDVAPTGAAVAETGNSTGRQVKGP